MTIPKIIQFHLWIFLALLVGLGSKDSVKKKYINQNKEMLI